MNNLKDKNVIARISILVFCLSIVLISITYAFINITLQGEKKQVITTGNLDLVLDEDENNLTITDALPMYDEVGMKQDPFTFRIINNTTTDTNYILKLTNITTGDALDTNVVKYGLTKNGVGEPALLSTLPDDGTVDSRTIGNKETIEYTLRLWIDASVTDNSVISGKSLSYRVDVEVSQIQEVPALPPSSIVFNTITANIGEKCQTYDDGIDTFLVGRCSNNYVWYSGKLWRVVLKNNKTGAVKMVTDNPITSIPYNAAKNTVFENSYAEQWLNQEFLPTLHDYEDYLVTDSVWDATVDGSDTPTRTKGTTTFKKTVGLLNAYEYYTTYASSEGLANSYYGYLNKEVYWWLMTPYSENSIQFVNSYGALANSIPTGTTGVRPSVNLKPSVQLSGGSGIESDPYILEGDIQESANGMTLLSTRYSGEYITFNNELYRIVGVENGLTKITAVNKPSELASNIFGSSTNFAESNIKTDLENYYQDLDSNWINMIQPDTTWYLGSVNDGTNYKESICANVETNISMNACSEKTISTKANIALPRIGEMFTSQIARKSRPSFWTLTPYVSSYVRSINYDCGSSGYYSINSTNGARPSMYLKSNVVIAETNTGNGTYEKPYTIELGA